MHLRRLRDLGRDLDRHLDALDLLVHHLLVRLANGKDLVTTVLHQCVVGNFLYQLMQVEVHLVALQNLGEQNQGAHLSFQDVVHLVVEHLHLVVFVVDVELRHLLKMDCFLDEVQQELVALE